MERSIGVLSLPQTITNGTTPDHYKAALYGSAITVDLPSAYFDAYRIRIIPNNQEVYVDSGGPTSILFDVLERTEPPMHPCESDEEALVYHYNDIIESEQENSGGEVTRVWEQKGVVLENLGPGIPAYTMTATQHPGPSETNGATSEEDDEPDFTVISLTIIRLEEQKTDILISVNSPHVPGQYNPEDVDMENGKLGPIWEQALRLRDMVLRTFKIESYDFLQVES